MDHYIEINLLPDPEFPASTLMNALFNKLHKALFDLHSKEMGVSFPNYEKTLGTMLRIHGSESNLQQLQALDWIGRMKDYCVASEVQPIPELVQYRTVSRKQDNMTNAKLRRLIARQEQRQDGVPMSETDIQNYQEKMVADQQKGPFLDLKSSKGQRYRRYIKLGELQNESVAGEFDQFGLSKTATVPWF